MKKTEGTSKDTTNEKKLLREVSPDQIILRPPRNRKRLAVEIFLLVVIVACIVGAVFLLVRKPVEEIKRTEEAKTVIQQIDAGLVTIIVGRDDFEVEGEGYEILTDGDSQLDSEAAIFELPEEVVLTTIGIIEMESIDLRLPLWDDAGIIPLRYGAGVQEGSVQPGETGNLVILGHRMKTYGSLFNRLGEIIIGAQIIISTMDGKTHVYTVDEIIPELLPSSLPEYISQDAASGKQVTLVTCTPTGIGTYRLIIIAHA